MEQLEQLSINEVSCMCTIQNHDTNAQLKLKVHYNEIEFKMSFFSG